jgi:predicted permease
MSMRAVWLRLRALLYRTNVEQELGEELDFHIEMQARKHRAAGLDAAEAMRRARLELGNVELVKEDDRDVRGVRPIEEFIYDLRYAIRGLRRAPAFALSVVLTIGVGVGINASVFTIFDGYVLRPFDVRDPYSLYSAQWADRTGHTHEFTANDYETLRRPNPLIVDVAGYRTFAARLGAAAATGDAVTPNYFGTAGVRPALGRTLLPDDRSAAVVVLSHSAWQNRFTGDSAVIGRRVLVHGYPFQIVGVAQQGFSGFFKKPRDFWIPFGAMGMLDSAAASNAPDREALTLLLRLNPAASASQGAAVIASVLQSSTAGLPDSSRFARVYLDSRATAIPRSFGAYLAFAPLAVAFGLILVLACANVANMLLARGLARQRELGTRLALGAARGRLVRQLVTESIVLALPAVAVGFALSWLAIEVGVRTLFATLPADLAAFVRLVPLHPDVRVLIFAFAATVGSALLFGLVPSLQATRLSVVDATRGNFAVGTSPTRLRNALVISQIAIASVLLIVAAILLRESARLGRTETGLRTRDVVSIEPENKLRPAVLAAIGRSRLLDTVAAATSLPLDMRFPPVSVTPSGDSAVVDAIYNRVSASYFDVLKIGIVNGRGFTPQEERSGLPAVIVSEAAAKRLWLGQSPLGRTIHLRLRSAGTETDPLKTYQNAIVVGVARNVVVHSVEDGAERSVLYFPMTITADGCCIIARVRGDPATTKRALDAELERAVPGGVERIDRLETFVAGAVYPYRAAYWISLALGVLALSLTVIGVYGVVSYVVGQRTREIGVRIALGATTRDVLALIMRQSLRHALTGVGIGALLALGVSQLLSSTIQNMPVFDGIAFAAAVACVLAACLLAALVPSRRAARVDPTAALRHD